MKSLIAIAALLIPQFIFAEPRMPVGMADLSDWSGVAEVEEGAAMLSDDAVASYVYADQNRVYYPGIKRDYYGDAADWSTYAGITFDVYSETEEATEVTVVLKVDPRDSQELNPVSTAKVRVAGKGWHSLFVPWEMFDVDTGQKWGTLFAIKRVEITATSSDHSDHRLRGVALAQGPTVALTAERQGKTIEAGGQVSYAFTVSNTTDRQQSIELRVQTMGWESMAATLEPSSIDLAPGETQTGRVVVEVPAKLPPGIREKQIVNAISNGDGASLATLELTTAVRVPSPYIMFSEEGWQAIRDKAEQYDWAKKGLDNYVKRAQGWGPPNPRRVRDDSGKIVVGESVYRTDGRHIFNCAIAYRLTGNEVFADKVMAMIRPLVDEDEGFPTTLVGGGDSFVGEGKFWQAIGRAYDLVRDSPGVTDEDRRLVDQTFRLFVTRTIQGNTRGAISNWNIAEIHAALYCALNLQDWHLIDQLLNAPTGVYAHLTHGIMNDGWWYECSVGYNTWVATQFSEVSLALEPWGINFADRQFPLGTTKHFSLLASRREGGIYGMQFEKWGKIERNSIGIKDMWDATVPFLDYRGVVPAINDAIDAKVSGKPYELAYYLYRDPEYAAVIRRGGNRDLLYGVPDLPEVTSQLMTQSAYADNMGVVQLRSQTPGREQREQIQAALHYGSHGGYHGHFDRTNLVSMKRYGRSFYGPLMYWYGYGSYLYKFLKQTSTTKNMVVVDEKQQEPVENDRTLFYTGDLMQATAIETVSRWSYPPYGGIVYDEDIPFAEKMWNEGRSIPVPDEQPAYGAVTAYTTPVIQRRVMVMLDDYIVLADYLQGEQEHQFDWMFQAKGFTGIVADEQQHLRHTPQMNTDPLGSAQFVTDCDWYETQDTAKTQFAMRFGKDADNAGVRFPQSEPGPLNIDVYTAWPKQQEIMIGTAPASFKVNKQLHYTIAADGQTLVEDRTGAWILGSHDLDVKLDSPDQLTLTTRVDNTRNNTVFWGDAHVVLRDGSEVPLGELPVKYDNVIQPEQAGRDYYGGPIKISGQPMAYATPGMPAAANQDATITVDLSGLDAVAFRARLGGDFPMGDESHRLKSMAVRTHGERTRYLAVIEPYEAESMVKSVTATSPDELIVELHDGRTQQITISGLDHTANDQTSVHVRELVDGKVMREETTE